MSVFGGPQEIFNSMVCEYMIVVTDRTKIGRIGDHDIFRLKEYKIVSFARNNLGISEKQINEEAAYISLLHSHLRSGQFHFSYSYDITHTQQRQFEMKGDKRPMWERADERFFWNYRLQSKFIDHTKTNRDQDLSNFILPIFNGFAEFSATEINKKPFTFVLISRRSRYRAGTRYFSRGVDSQGNVSNFNETEQLLIVEHRINSMVSGTSRNVTTLSHVQTRGSIPIFWAQINNIKYTPKLQIFDDPQTDYAFRRHFETQKRIYGRQLVINLINKKGYEEPMGSAFSKQIDIMNDPQIKYYHFDFHQESELSKFGYTGNSSKQTSVVRTNCMDCLDRTNVVQSVIARWVLTRQLQEVGVLSTNESFDSHDQFELLFRNVWADNADVISYAYSGTGALKTDFTRTGQRTKLGAMLDLQNSIVRYVKNNFLDGARQRSKALQGSNCGPGAQQTGHLEENDAIESERSDRQLSISIDERPRGGAGGTEAMSVVKAATSTSKDSPAPHMYHGKASRVCVVKPTGKNHQNQEPKKPGSVPEFFERVTAGWKEICATTIANLIVHEYLKEAKSYKTSPDDSDRDGKEPNVDNVWSVNADNIDWDMYRYYFNKKDHILPYVDRHWKALCTDRSRTPTWWATLGSCLYISKDVFAATDEQARSASSDFCLVKSNLWNMKPGHITSHQSSSSKSQSTKGHREVKRKANGAITGNEESGSKRSNNKAEKTSKPKSSSSSIRHSTFQTAVPPATYIPLPNTVVTNNTGNTLTPFSSTNEHPYNRHRFKYVTCEPDPLLQYMLYRQSASPTLYGVHLSREDMSPYMFIDDECKTITTEKGFRTVRANCGVREGRWYYEVNIDKGGEARYEGRDGAHVRLGWARREATLQAPVGFDAYSYGVRDTTGEKVHMSKVAPFGEPFKTGDVIGLYISLPPDGNEQSFFKHRRLRRSFMFKGQLYFESVDYSPTKRYIEMAEYEATPIKTNLVMPVPPPIIPNSKIIVYKNGVCQGVMWQDLHALLPIEQNEKEKEQLRFDDGTLGYYPAVSVYRNGTATVNFGPDFEFPPGKDPEADAEHKTSRVETNTWKPMSDRWEENLVEECLIDLVDEVELWVSQQSVLEERTHESPLSKTDLAGTTVSTLQRNHSTSSRLELLDEYEDSELSSSGRRHEILPREAQSDDEDGDVDMDSGIDQGQEHGYRREYGDEEDEEDFGGDAPEGEYREESRDLDMDGDGGLHDDDHYDVN
ncbi:hypothetical protein BG004_001268 [Podila humilis]|nr:hypothetical protein BG004_001268 [Podila humilis]